MTTISFETWRKRFENGITRRSPAWTAIQRCTEYAGQPASQLPEWLLFWLSEDPGWANDIHTSILRLIYNITITPPPITRSKQKRDAYTRKTLHDLTKQAESFVQHLKYTAEEDGTAERVMVTPDHDLFTAVNLSPVLAAYENAAAASRYFLNVLERIPYSRKPDVLRPCIALMGILSNKFEVPEAQALELGRLAMLAHGYSEDDLEEMRNPSKVRDGKFRKRKEASHKRISSLKATALRNPTTEEPIEVDSITFYSGPTRKN
jgi:hypothetical protein